MFLFSGEKGAALLLFSASSLTLIMSSPASEHPVDECSAAGWHPYRWLRLVSAGGQSVRCTGDPGHSRVCGWVRLPSFAYPKSSPRTALLLQKRKCEVLSAQYNDEEGWTESLCKTSDTSRYCWLACDSLSLRKSVEKNSFWTLLISDCWDTVAWLWRVRDVGFSFL